MFYDDSNDEVISQWVRKVQEQTRILLNSKRFPSDVSLASTSSSASGWSGVSGHSGGQRLLTTHSGHSQQYSTGQAVAGGVATVGGGAFQYMDTS